MLYNPNLFKIKPKAVQTIPKAKTTPTKTNYSNPANKTTPQTSTTSNLSLANGVVDPFDGKGSVTSTHLQDRSKLGLGMNNGIDIAIAGGTPIKSIFSGKVVDVNYHKNGYGHLVTVQNDDGTQAVYAHMQAQSPLKIGQTINAGDIVGKVGKSGLATGNHLSLQVGKSQFNPKTKGYITAKQAKNEPGRAIDPLSILTNRKK